MYINRKKIQSLCAIFFTLTTFNVNAQELNGDDKNIKINLTVENFVREVYKRNVKKNLDELQEKWSENKMVYEKDIFKPQLFVTASKQSVNNPNAAEEVFSRAGQIGTNYQEDSNTVETGFSGILPSGAKWSLSVESLDRQSSTIDKLNMGFDTEYDDTLKVSFTQPLWKDFGEDITLAKYYIAKSDLELNQIESKKNTMNLISTVLNIYWKFYGTLRLSQSLEESIKLNQKIYEVLLKSFKKGEVDHNKVLEVENELYLKKAEYNNVNSALNEIQNQMLDLLNISKKNGKVLFNPIENPNDNIVEYLSINSYFEQSLDNLVEIQNLNAQIKKQKIETKIAENSIKPELNFIFYTDSQTYKYDRTYDYYDRDFITWNAGLQLKVPLTIDKNKKYMEMTKIKETQLELQLNSIENNIYNAIDTKLTDLVMLKKQLENYEVALKLKEKMISNLTQALEHGEINIKELIDEQNKLIQLKKAYYKIIVEWKLSEASLNKAIGKLTNRYISENEIGFIKKANISQELNQNNFGKIE